MLTTGVLERVGPTGSGLIPGVDGLEARFDDTAGTVEGCCAVSRRRLLLSKPSRGVDTDGGGAEKDAIGVAAGVEWIGLEATGVGCVDAGANEGVRVGLIVEGEARIEGCRV